MDYQETDYGYDDYGSQDPNSGAVKGLKVVIIILIVVLVALGFLYFRQVQNLKGESALLMEEKDTLTGRLSRLMGDYGNLQFDNDTLNKNLMSQRMRGDSLMDKLTKERSWSRAKIREYEREIGTLRTTMQGFVRQIDSLGRLTQKQSGEILKYRKQISSLENRVAASEEKASELSNKVQKGSVIKASNITLRARNKRDKEIVKAKQADMLVVSFILTANELSTPGDRTIYVRIIGPDGIDIQGSRGTTFSLEGETTPYTVSRTVQYEGVDLPVSIYYPESADVSKLDLSPGMFTVMIYMDGSAIGSAQINLK